MLVTISVLQLHSRCLPLLKLEMFKMTIVRLIIKYFRQTVDTVDQVTVLH